MSAEVAPEPSPRRSLRGDVLVVLPAWVSARLLVLAGVALALVIAEDEGGVRPVALEQGLLAWDGAFYDDIADHGYRALDDEALRFFPLYAVLGRLVGLLLLGWTEAGLVVVASAAALAAGVLVRRLALLERPDDPDLADRAAWLLMLVPPAFVLVLAYAEALYLALAIGTFLALRQRLWGWAGGLGALAALTRPHGLFLVLPAAVEAARGLRGLAVGEMVRRAAAVVGPIAGTAVFLGWVAVQGEDPFVPFSVQSDFRGELIDPLSRLARGVTDLVGDETWGDGLHLPFAVVLIALVVVLARRWPASYTAYAGAIVLVSLSAENLNSLERYGLDAFPVVLALATVTAAPRVERLTLALCGGGLVSLTALAMLGEYVP